ncbi:unnamed protein product [Allacma fusca]|uniref:Uncharacterized protein n=1 Tax=Allacma fusca TaxID=39272 RepID=A0A8J2NP40_9HEXA|nr:unnamed protein product [Allacma fusca]
MFIYNINTLFRQSDLIKFHNEIIHYRKHLKDVNVPLRSIPFVAVFVLITVGRNLALVSAAICHPTSPVFLYAILPPSWRNGWGHKIFLAFYIPSNVILWASLHFAVATIMIHIVTIGDAVNHFSQSQLNLNHKAGVKIYRELLLFSRLFENAFGKIGFLTNLVSLTSLLIVSAYGTVRFFGRVEPMMYVGLVVPVFGINVYMRRLLLPSSLIAEHSVEFKRNILTSIKNEEPWEAKFVKTTVRSLPDLKVRVGSCFSIQRKTYITFLGIISLNTMTLLISL